MSTVNCLTEAEETMLRGIYQRDVKYWSWDQWVASFRKHREAPMGFLWVILPYKPMQPMPIMRKRMNDLYLEAVEQQAAEYGLAVRIDAESNKLVLFDPATSKE